MRYLQGFLVGNFWGGFLGIFFGCFGGILRVNPYFWVNIGDLVRTDRAGGGAKTCKSARILCKSAVLFGYFRAFFV